MTRVCILDYGSGNVRSVFNLLSSTCADVAVSNQEARILDSTHIVLPGVGSFGAAMRKIIERIPLEALRKAALEQCKPFLGICVGMQVLATEGDEFGAHAGLGWIPGRVERLDSGKWPLPHIGWNNVTLQQPSPLLAGLEAEPDFYFLHSYAFSASDPDCVRATTQYGQEFCSVVQAQNITGVQFHPEKSQRAGIRLVENFLAMA